MTAFAPSLNCAEPRYHGLRMTAEDYFSAEDDGFRYELVHGVMLMSPSPKPPHQATLVEIIGQVYNRLVTTNEGDAFIETDVHFGKNAHGEDIVYRPEIVIYLKDNQGLTKDRLIGAPDVVVEIVSADSRSYDSKTKLKDYEKFGVREYWLIDPLRGAMVFYRLERGCFVEVPVKGDRFVSAVLAGFELDLQRVRRTFP